MLKTTMQPRYYKVPVVERTFDILELLQKTSRPLKMAAIAEETGVARSTTYRILRTLVSRGYALQSTDGGYSGALSEAAGREIMTRTVQTR